ncbi:MAG: DUF1540 domain-containing protein [Clostridia bacterium]|nr:DUF1540 domain-containing protein [Clostridia bacterium]
MKRGKKLMRHVIKDINCKVSDCIYNEGNGTCSAGKIEVGPSHASSCSDTLCNTFECDGSGCSKS